MNYFKLNIQRLSTELLPTFLRKPIIIAFLLVVTTPLIAIYLAFTKFRKAVDYELHHNGQVCYLRKVLNDHFDPLYRRIEIREEKSTGESVFIYTKNEDEDDLVIYTKSENQEPTYIYTYPEINGYTRIDFIILIPKEVYDEQVTVTREGDRFYKIEALADKYKLVTKHYKIEKI